MSPFKGSWFAREKSKGKYTHFCRKCYFVWKDKKWVDTCPNCGNDFTSSGNHKLRNVIYGEDRHPKAVKEEGV